MLLSRLHLCLICILRVPSSLALTLQPIADVPSLYPSSARTNKTFPGPASLLLDIPGVVGRYPLGPGLPDPTCNGNLLGFDMNRYSCLQAWNTIPLSGHEVTFGERFSDNSEVELPRRYSSRKCFILYPITKTFFAVGA